MREERTRLLLRGVGAGLTAQQMAEVFLAEDERHGSLTPGFDRSNQARRTRAMKRMIRDAEESPSVEADAFTIQARVEGPVDEGMLREGAEHLVREQDRRHTQETHDAEAAAWRVRRDALEARARALMEWVKAEGDGVRLEYDQRAREIVEHVEGLKLPMNPQTVRWVADRLGGYPNGITEPERPQSGDQVGWAKYRKRLRVAREPMARRVIGHVTGERPGA